MVPILCRDESRFSSDVVPLIILGGRLDILRQKFPTAIAMKLQFFDPFGKGAEITVKLILFFARNVQKTVSARHKQPIANSAEDDEPKYGRKDFPGKPSKVNSATENHRNIHADNGNRQQRLSDVEYVTGQGNQNSRRADLLQSEQWDRQYLANQSSAQFGYGPLR